MKFEKSAAFGLLLATLATPTVFAEEEAIELETTRIKANRELPQILYIVPWKDFEAPAGNDRKLKLHDFFGDLYDPLLGSEAEQLNGE
ncbi:hypothetical protein ACXYTJ_00580 [Gilvimarinus sp. F26214L]|uniref:hypothetical protein n=1 Tax=Gilvimarinus sp. DZF01 TaxID=3461371 RepID=UPI004045D32E